MKRRREHGECESHEGGRGCLVFDTPICGLKKKDRLASMRRWVSQLDPVVLWGLIMAIGVLLGLAWGTWMV